jgi:MYXO-CTERM domain-containing protein
MWCLLATVLLGVLACASEPPEASSLEGPLNASVASTSRASAARAGVRASAQTLDTAPHALRAAAIASTQRDAGEAYAARPDGRAFVASAAGFEVRYDAQGARVRAAHEEVGRVRLASVGCSTGIEYDVGFEVTPMASANRVTYAKRAGGAQVEEWYLTGPLGLEQGFTMHEPPPCARSGGEIEFVVAVPGFTAQASDDRALLVGANGDRYVYSDLLAKGADERPLPAQLRVRDDGRIALAIDVTRAAWPIEVDPLIWGQHQKLLANDGMANHEFGGAVAIHGTTAFVGAVNAANGTGAVYVYSEVNGGWNQQQKLVASDAAINEDFGSAIALAADTAVVGARFDNGTRGAAYVFVRLNGVWSEQQKLTGSDGVSGDAMGSSVALSGDTALVGAEQDAIGTNDAQGSAYVFVRANGVWSQQQKLTATDGATDDLFGGAVALSGDTAVVGAREDGVGLNDTQGSAYVFVLANGAWSQQQKLTATDGAMDDLFGSSVGVNGDVALVGAVGDNGPSGLDQGSVYAYVRSNGAWSQVQKIVASDAASDDAFGASIALGTDFAVVGADLDNVSSADQGSAYLLVRTNGVWSEKQKIVAKDGAGNDFFGRAVAWNGSTILVGADGDDTGSATNQGSAYVFTLKDANGDPCASAGECASGFCVDGVCCNSACGGGATNDCQACSLAAGAATNGTCAAVTGSSCSDGNACTQTDTCQAGVCVGATPVVCSALDQCHVVGTCNPATGLCSNPNQVDGTNCNDGNACTQTDRCDGGSCVGGQPVTCTPLDQCHVAGTCDPMTGVCSNPNKADGSACSDGDACTQTDTCVAGGCSGANPKVCVPLDQCHVAGTCNPMNGVCSNPNKADGSGCSDGDACTQTDTCVAGSCSGANPKVCVPLDACHDAGTCNPVDGVCTNPSKPDGSACSDGNACTSSDACQAGLCASGAAVQCDDGNDCTSETCVPLVGCVFVDVPNDAACNDGNVCSDADRCQAGMCVAGRGLDCNDDNACTADNCDSSDPSGCVHVPDVGLPCDDGNLCTVEDSCSVDGSGNATCLPGTTVDCDDLESCTVDGCDPLSGCTHDPVADGTPCTQGECLAGQCVPPAMGGGGMGGTPSVSGGTGGAGGEPLGAGGGDTDRIDSAVENGCGCVVVGDAAARARGGIGAVAFLGLVAAWGVRRRRRAA